MDEAFFNQFLDADLQAALSSSVPPGDIQAIGSFRPIAINNCGRDMKKKHEKQQPQQQQKANSLNGRTV